MNRFWTLRVPETTKIPYEPIDNVTKFEIISVPIVVKAYSCEVERVKDGDQGSYNLIGQNPNAMLIVMADTIERKWNLAVVNGKDTSIYELTPEHWTSYLAVKDSQTAQFENVPVQISVSCFSIDFPYILLLFIYTMMTIVGITCFLITSGNKLKVPSGVIGWANQACKESGNYKESYNSNEIKNRQEVISGITDRKNNLFDYNLTIYNETDVTIIPKNESELVNLKE